MIRSNEMKICRLGMAIAGVVVLLAGCAAGSGARSGSTTSTATPPAREQGMASQRMGMMGDMCPMHVQGTTVTMAEVEGGVALEFKTAASNVTDLRERVRRMADMHNQCCGVMTSEGMMMPAASASVEEIEGGARLVLRPKDAARLATLREHVRMHAGRMASGDCPMMPGQTTPPAASDDAEHNEHHPSPEQLKQP
jgi:hypothetical protein